MIARAKRRCFHSLRFRFFASVALAAAVFVIVMIVLNLLFFHSYYLLQKKNRLTYVYNRINEQYNGDISILDEKIKQLENRDNIRISIVNDYGEYIYDTIFARDRSFGWYNALTQNPFGKTLYVYDSNELEQKGYTFSTLNDPDGSTAYLALLGRLDTGDMLLLRIPTAALRENQSLNFVFLMISGLISLSACLLAGYFIGKRYTRPVIEMTEVANSVAKLDFSKKYTGSHNDELGELGRSINQMSDYLETAISDMQEMNRQLQIEIDEKQRIDDMRREFIINVSHDLKTPIALIQGYAEGLRVGINESEEDKNYYCDIIIDEAHRMNHLVRQLLDLSKIELGNIVPEKTDIEAYELAEAVVSKTQVMWQEKQLNIDMSGIGPQLLHGDYDLLERALLNYMTNAIDHTPEYGHISIFTTEDSCHLLLCVRNQGSRLNPEEMDKIWDKFYKLDKSRTRVSGGGSGIGLSIVRAIMTAHHGGCGVRNVEDGVEFYLSLPKNTETV
ncbi:MAG TPA: hypothetical protein DDX51_03685 [Clostridiales bacterium]|nr:hypothetical protein [Clostridiales bacterium]